MKAIFCVIILVINNVCAGDGIISENQLNEEETISILQHLARPLKLFKIVRGDNNGQHEQRFQIIRNQAPPQNQLILAAVSGIHNGGTLNVVNESASTKYMDKNEPVSKSSTTIAAAAKDIVIKKKDNVNSKDHILDNNPILNAILAANSKILLQKHEKEVIHKKDDFLSDSKSANVKPSDDEHSGDVKTTKANSADEHPIDAKSDKKQSDTIHSNNLLRTVAAAVTQVVVKDFHKSQSIGDSQKVDQMDERPAKSSSPVIKDQVHAEEATKTNQTTKTLIPNDKPRNSPDYVLRALLAANHITKIYYY